MQSAVKKSSNDVKSVHTILAFPFKYSMKQRDASLCSRQESAHNNKSSEICSFRGTSNQIPHSTHAGGWCQISQFVFNTSVFLHIAVCQTLKAHSLSYTSTICQDVGPRGSVFNQIMSLSLCVHPERGSLLAGLVCDLEVSITNRRLIHVSGSDDLSVKLCH